MAGRGQHVTPGELGFGRSSEAAKCPLTDPVKSPKYNGRDFHRRTGETYKNNRRTTVLHGSSGSASAGPRVHNGARLRTQASAILEALSRTNCTVKAYVNEWDSNNFGNSQHTYRQWRSDWPRPDPTMRLQSIVPSCAVTAPLAYALRVPCIYFGLMY